FLRKMYKDPITGKDFRLIRLNPDGSLAGSKLFVQNVNSRPLFGNTQTFGQQQQQQQGTPQAAQSQQPTQPTQAQPTQAQPTPTQPTQQGSVAPQSPSPQSPSQQFGQTQTQPGALPGFSPIGNAGTTTISAAPIVGVASDSDRMTVMEYNKRQKYNEWEFIAI